MEAPTRVVKIGGSLLGGRLIGTRLEAWLANQPRCATLLVVGGGQLADAVRRLDACYGLSAEVAHQQAVRAMRVNSFILLHLCNRFHWLGCLSDWPLPDCDLPAAFGAILDPVPLVLGNGREKADTTLPVGWQVTSDSIAARVAERVGACELVLLKSTIPSTLHVTTEMAADQQYVDAYFPVAASEIPLVRAVNLRDPLCPERRLNGRASY